jgi:hypothetical protein
LRDNKFEPTLTAVPTGSTGVRACKIYRESINRPIVNVGTINDNETARQRRHQ